MTILALDSSVATDLKNDKVFAGRRPISPERFPQTTGQPRFNLRKRPCSQNDKPEVNLTAVTSAFLSGIFADVAAAQNQSPEITSSSCQTIDSNETLSLANDNRLDSNAPNKKSRANLDRSMSRCFKSYKILGDLVSPDHVMTTFFDDYTQGKLVPSDRVDSLQFQLSCVSDAACTDNSAADDANATSLVFPFLPNTVSNSSCVSSITRSLSDLQSSITETSVEKEVAYGWFVEMDDDGDRYQVDSYTTSNTTSALAFCAPTAPKGNNYDDELEWAKAADTVDDVLGDFF